VTTVSVGDRRQSTCFCGNIESPAPAAGRASSSIMPSEIRHATGSRFAGRPSPASSATGCAIYPGL